MGLEETLRQLGKEIQSDPRFAALKAAAAKNDADESLQKQMQEMQLLSLKYQQEAGKGEDADSAKIEDLQKQYSALYEEIMKNENMEAYSAAASQMEEMAQYISKMIGLFFDGQDPETCEIPDESCLLREVLFHTGGSGLQAYPDFGGEPRRAGLLGPVVP